MTIESPKFNNIKTSVLTPSVFLVVGAIKTAADYKKAPQNEKNKTLATDTALLTSAGLGYVATSFALKKFYKLDIGAKFNKLFEQISKKLSKNDYLEKISSKYKKPDISIPKNIQEGIAEVIKGCFDNILTTTGGIVASVLTAIYILPNLLKHVKETQKSEENAKISEAINKEFSEELLEHKENENDPLETSRQRFISDQIASMFNGKNANAIISILADHPELRGLGGAMMSLTAHDIASEKDGSKRLKMASYEILTYTLGPAFFVSIASVITKNLKAAIKIPAVLVSLFLGGITGSLIAKATKDKIDNIIDTKFYKKEE